MELEGLRDTQLATIRALRTEITHREVELKYAKVGAGSRMSFETRINSLLRQREGARKQTTFYKELANNNRARADSRDRRVDKLTRQRDDARRELKDTLTITPAEAASHVSYESRIDSLERRVKSAREQAGYFSNRVDDVIVERNAAQKRALAAETELQRWKANPAKKTIHKGTVTFDPAPPAGTVVVVSTDLASGEDSSAWRLWSWEQKPRTYFWLGAGA